MPAEPRLWEHRRASKTKLAGLPACVRMTLGPACKPAADTRPLDLAQGKSTLQVLVWTVGSLYRKPGLVTQSLLVRNISCPPILLALDALHDLLRHCISPRVCLCLVQPGEDLVCISSCLRAMHRHSDYLDVSKLSISTNNTPLEHRLSAVHCRVIQEH